MSEFHVEVVSVGKLEPHPNADRLWVTHVHGYPVCVAKDTLREGDLAVYVPVDSVVPADDARWSFLAGHTRIQAKRLRGVFSMGLLTEADPSWTEGQDVAEALRIVRWEPVVRNPEQDEPDPGIAPVYDVEGWRRWCREEPSIFGPDEDVAVTEKYHGENGRFAWYEKRLWCGSHYNWKLDTPKSQWWRAARAYGLDKILPTLPEDRPLVFCGEVFGNVSDMNYGHSVERPGLAFFNILDVKRRVFLDWREEQQLLAALGLPSVPVLYEGPFSGVTTALAEGLTTYPRAASRHIREGFVVRPLVERTDPRIGRVALKLHGEGYLTRKGG